MIDSFPLGMTEGPGEKKKKIRNQDLRLYSHVSSFATIPDWIPWIGEKSEAAG